MRLSLQISQTRKRICHAKRVRSKLQGVPSLGVFLFRGQTCALEDVQTCSITLFCSSQPVVFFSHTTPAAASSTSQPTVFSSHTTPAAASSTSQANRVVVGILIGQLEDEASVQLFFLPVPVCTKEAGERRTRGKRDNKIILNVGLV